MAEYSICLSGAVAFSSYVDFLKRYYYDVNEASSALVAEVLRSGGQIILLVMLLNFSALDGVYSMYTVMGGAVLSAAALLPYKNRHLLRLNFDPVFRSKILKFNCWAAPSVVFESAQSALPMFMASAILGEASVGLLRAMQQLANILNMPFNLIQQIVPSIAAKKYSNGGQLEVRRMLIVVTLCSVFAVAVGAGIVLVKSDFFIGYLMGINSVGTDLIFILFVVFNVTLLVRLPLIIGFNTLQKPSIVFYSNLLSFVVAITLSLGIISSLGAIAIPLIGIVNTMLGVLYYVFYYKVSIKYEAT